MNLSAVTKCLISLSVCHKHRLGWEERSSSGSKVPSYKAFLNRPWMYEYRRQPPGSHPNVSLLLIICEDNDMKWEMIKMIVLSTATQPQYRNCWRHLLLKTQNWRASLHPEILRSPSWTVKAPSACWESPRNSRLSSNTKQARHEASPLLRNDLFRTIT